MKTTIEYLHILHVIWTVVSYYARLFGMDAGEEPAGTKTFLLEREGVTFIRFMFPSCDTAPDREYSFWEMAEIMQQYLDYCILPEEKILRPYQGGSTVYDIVEPLYIDRVQVADGWMQLEVVYIDDPLAFSYVRKRRGLQQKGGI